MNQPTTQMSDRALAIECFLDAVRNVQRWEPSKQIARLDAALRFIRDYDDALKAVEALGYEYVESWQGYTLFRHADTERHIIHDYCAGLLDYDACAKKMDTEKTNLEKLGPFAEDSF